MSRLKSLLMAVCVSALASTAFAGFQGTLFFNYKNNLATNNPTVTNAFGIDRAAVRWTETFADKFSGAIQFDLDTSASLGYYYLYMKEASLGWNIIPQLQLLVGMQQSLSYKVPEDFWGHRYVYKSFVDQNTFINTFDLGVSARARLLNSNLTVNLAVFNGEGFKKLELNNIFQYCLSAGYEHKMFTFYAYGDLHPYRNALGATSNTGDQLTFTSVAGFKLTNLFRVGVEFNAVNNKAGSTNASAQQVGLSSYAMCSPLPWLEVFGRFDYMWTRVNATHFYTIIAGVQFTPPKYNKVAGALTFKTTQYPWSYGATAPTMSIGLDFLASFASKDLVPAKTAAAPAPKAPETAPAPATPDKPATEEKKPGA